MSNYPRAFAWFNLVSRFTPAVRSAWGGSAAAPAKDQKAQTKSAVEETQANKPSVPAQPKKQQKEESKAEPSENAKKGFNGLPATIREYYEDSYRVSH